MGQRYGYRSCKTSTWHALMLDAQNVKKDFPIFSNDSDLHYFDSASTTQKPQAVIDSVSSFYSSSNANIHRALYKIGETATNSYENVRIKSEYFSQKMLRLISEFPLVFEELRGSGLMLGLKTKIENTSFTNEAYKQNLLLAPASDNVVRILPPLNITKKEVDYVVELLSKTAQRLEN